MDQNRKNTVVITRVSKQQWHALEENRVVGHGDVSSRPDGRHFLSVDTWHSPVFDQLAKAMLTDLPKPLHTVVDEADLDLISHWQHAGFTNSRREWEYLVPTDPRVTGFDSMRLPQDVTMVPLNEAELDALRDLDRVIRAEVEAAMGWQAMPAEVLARPHGITQSDLAMYAAATQAGEYVGLVRVTQVTRQPRIGLIAVRSDRQRRGIARALLATVLGSLHRSGIKAATAEIAEVNKAATALFEGVGAQRTNSNLELVCR